MAKFKVATVQLDYSLIPSKRLGRILGYISLAKKKGASIVCFPEQSIGGDPKNSLTYLKEIRARCREEGIWCITGGYIAEGRKTYNAAMLVDDNGNIAGKHKKVHLCDPPVIAAGSSFNVFDTPFCKIGIAICWDVAFTDAIETMARDGAELVFCPMYWLFDEWAHEKNHHRSEKRILQSLLLARAYESLLYVVFSNPVHPKTKWLLASYSGIAEPHRILKEIYGKEGMIISEIDLDYLRKIRKRYHKDYDKFIYDSGKARSHNQRSS